jgi:hypothetical protein
MMNLTVNPAVKRVGKMAASAAPFVLLFSIVIVCATLLHAEDKTFTGAIMDSQCVSMGGHETMYSDEIKNPKDCTIQCVKYDGGKYELYNIDTQKAYQLDDQKKAEQFAGEKVTVTGSYDDSSETIHITKIESAK